LATRSPYLRAQDFSWHFPLRAAACALVLSTAWPWAGALAAAADHAAKTPTAPTAPTDPVTPTSPTTDHQASPLPARTGVRFTLDVQAPPPLDALLQRHLDIQRFQELPDLDAGELRRLVNQLPTDAQGLLGTQGFFTPDIRTELVAPAASDPSDGLWQVKVKVVPGPVSLVGDVLVALGTQPAPDGSIPTTPQADPLREAAHLRLRQQWSLGSGQPFSQSAWDEAKAQSLRSLSTERYLNARLINSLADVDTDTHTVNLAVELDPGPAFSFGPVRMEGLQRYEAVWMENLVRAAGVHTGAPYRLQDLQAAQQRLAQSGYFDSVFVYVDPDTDPSAAPVQVQVREARRGRLRLGAGISTDSGPRLSAEHTWNRVPVLDWRATSQLQIDGDNPNLLLNLRSPVDAKGWQWTTRFMADEVRLGDTRTASQQVQAGRLHEGQDINRHVYLQLDRSLTDNPSLRLAGPLSADTSISAHVAWSRSRLNQPTAPQQGHGLAVEAGVGITLGSPRLPFARTRVRWQGLVPLGSPVATAASAPLSQPAAPNTLGRIALRAEAGVVAAADRARVPDSQLFWAGGDQSVRGYSLRDLGVAQTDGTLRPGRLLTVGSVEWQRPIVMDGQVSLFESAVFADIGAVADRSADLSARAGVGAGVRMNTPAGPIQFDLAYGLTPKRWRIHFSVGLSF
jgi:translocation and assembly module TamA